MFTELYLGPLIIILGGSEEFMQDLPPLKKASQDICLENSSPRGIYMQKMLLYFRANLAAFTYSPCKVLEKKLRSFDGPCLTVT